MNEPQAYYLAQRKSNGCPGLPIGNDDGAMMLFEELDVARTIRDKIMSTSPELGKIHVFKVAMKFIGEVL